MLTYKEFEIIKTLMQCEELPDAGYIHDHIYFELFNSKEEISQIMNDLICKGFIADGKLTEKAYEEMEPCKVDNAIILAAGGAAKNSKSLYSLPKGLYVKNGEPLIERQIRQLQEAGIKDITIVLGYRQELYLYLEKKFGVKLSNTPAIEKGNVVTLNAVKDRLNRTYICSCDNYFVENPFSLYEYDSFHSTVFKNDCIHEVQIRQFDMYFFAGGLQDGMRILRVRKERPCPQSDCRRDGRSGPGDAAILLR